MNADDCAKKADACLAAAQYASDRESQRIWRELAEMWSLWAGLLHMLPATDADAAPTDELQNGTGSVVPTELANEPANADNRQASEMADRLRSRLSLTK